MFSLTEMTGLASELKRAHGRVITNNYLYPEALEEVARMKDASLYKNEEAIAFCYTDHSVRRLCFYLQDEKTFTKLDELLRGSVSGPVVAEYIGKQGDVTEVADRMEANGFSCRAMMKRMRARKLNLPDPAYHGDCLLRKAAPGDAAGIVELLDATFDKYVSHLPTESEIMRLIEQELVFVAEKGQITGVCVFQKNGSAGLYLYQLAIHKDYQKGGLGKALCAAAFGTAPSFKNYTLWIDSKNYAGIRLYEGLGFLDDGLWCAVMLYEGGGEDNHGKNI